MKAALLLAFGLLLAVGPIQCQIKLPPGCQSCSDIACPSPGTQCRLIINPNCSKDAPCDCRYIPICAPTRRCRNCDSIACGEGFECSMLPAGPESLPCTHTPSCVQKACPAMDLCGFVTCPANTHCEVRYPILADGSDPCSPAGTASCCAFSICESNQKNNPCNGISCPEFSFCHVGTGGKPKCVAIPPKARYS